MVENPSKSSGLQEKSPFPTHRSDAFLSLRTLSEAKKSVTTRSARFWIPYVPLLVLFLSFSYFLTNHVSGWASFNGREATQIRVLTADNAAPAEREEGGTRDEEQGRVSGPSQDLGELGEPLNAAPVDLVWLEGVDTSWLDEEDSGAGTGISTKQAKSTEVIRPVSVTDDGSRVWPVIGSHKANETGSATDGDVPSANITEVLNGMEEHSEKSKTSEDAQGLTGETVPNLPFPFVLESSSATKNASSEFFVCDRSGERSDVCILRGEVLVLSRHNLVVLHTRNSSFTTRVETIRPYTKKWDPGVTANIWEFTVRTVNGSARGLAEEVEGVGEGGGGREGAEESVTETGRRRRRRKLLQEPQGSGSGDSGSEQSTAIKEEKETGGREGQKGEEKRVEMEEGSGKGARTVQFWSGIQGTEGGGWDLADDKDAPPLIDGEGKTLNPEGRWELFPNPSDGKARFEREDDVPRPLRCDVRHNVTGLLPLFITTQEYSGEVLILVAEWHRNWLRKFGSIFRQLSNYPPVLLGLGDETHCFPQIVVGQVAHEEYVVQREEMRHKVGIGDFQKVIGRAFHAWPPTTAPLQEPPPDNPSPGDCAPLLTILVRDGSRKIRNVDQVVGWAHTLGFGVRLVEPTHGMRLEELWGMLQEADVMLGVHGAALTHWIFLRPSTVFIQLVPFGMIWTAKLYYGDPATQLPLQYMEVLLEPHESSLIEKYPANHTVFTNQQVYWDQGWNMVADLYFHNQDVTWSESNAMRILKQAKEKWERAKSLIQISERGKRCEIALKE